MNTPKTESNEKCCRKHKTAERVAAVCGKLLRQRREEAVERLFVAGVHGFFVLWVYVVAVQALTGAAPLALVVPTQVLLLTFVILLIAASTCFHFQRTRSRATNPVPAPIISNGTFEKRLNRAIFESQWLNHAFKRDDWGKLDTNHATKTTFHSRKSAIISMV